MMSAEAIRHSQEHDELFTKYGGTLAPLGNSRQNKNKESNCTHAALMNFIRENDEPLPLTAQRAEEIGIILRHRQIVEA